MRKEHNSYGARTLKYIASALLPVALLCIFYLLCISRETMNTIQDKFSLPALRFLGKTFSAFPISFLEIFTAIAILAVIIYIIKLLSAMLSIRRGRIFTLLRYILILVIILAWIWNFYCWLWNVGYYADSFSEKAGLQSDGIEYDKLYSAAEFFLEKTNELSTRVNRDDDGIFCGEFDEFVLCYDTVYDKVDEEFPFLQGQTTEPKGVVFSGIMSKLGFTGLLFPLSGETYINTEQPDWDIPNTIAHEIAHQRGVHFEAEANFLGIAACIQSDNIAFRYSGYMLGLIHLTNAIYSVSPDDYKKLCSDFSDELRADLQNNSEYWSAQKGTANDISDKVYTAFLQVNKQPSGLKSYGECVDLLVSWLNTSDYSPMEG